MKLICAGSSAERALRLLLRGQRLKSFPALHNFITKKGKYMTIPDIQNEKDERCFYINKVGINNLMLPLKIQDNRGRVYTATATIEGYNSLSEEKRGTHMSRFIRIFNEFTDKIINLNNIKSLMRDISVALGADKTFVGIKFLYFIEKLSPISKLPSYLSYECFIECEQNKTKDIIVYGVNASILSLCPASKAISERNAHNQRGIVKLKVKARDDLDFEKLITLVEKHSSCELYGILKLEDEKYVTERSYDNPKFVEDTVRDIAGEVSKMGFEYWFVSCENLESIHTHNAYAEIEYGSK